MSELVEVKNGFIFTTSNIICEEFDMAHNELLKKIRSFTDILAPVRFKEMYKEFDYENSRGRKYKSFKLNRDGYMFLVMNIMTKKSATKKMEFIDAFNLMEKILLNQSNSEWLNSREQGKQIRKDETDTIKEFIEYATSQGSKSAKFYYKHYTNATYRVLELLEYKKPKVRNTLDMLQLNQLLLAENIVTKTIQKEMESKEHYKVIFEKCKTALELFADGALVGSRRYVA